MSIEAALAYEEEIERMMRIAERREALRPAAAIRVSDSTLQWEPILTEPDVHFQEMMKHLQHRVAQEMAIPAAMLGTPRLTAQEVQQRQQEQMMRLHLRPDGGFEEEARFLREQLLGGLGVDNADLNALLREAGKGPTKTEEPAAPVVKKYGRMLEP